MHSATGIGWGVNLAVAKVILPRVPAFGLAIGPVAWLTSYAVLPLLKVYKPMWEYDTRTLAKDFSAHLVFGAATAVGFALLTRGARSRR